MTPTCSQKGRFRHRYYVRSRAHRRGWKTCPSPSIPATEIEKVVIDRIRAIGQDPDLVSRMVGSSRHVRSSTTAQQARAAQLLIGDDPPKKNRELFFPSDEYIERTQTPLSGTRIGPFPDTPAQAERGR